MKARLKDGSFTTFKKWEKFNSDNPYWMNTDLFSEVYQRDGKVYMIELGRAVEFDSVESFLRWIKGHSLEE